MTLGTEIVYLVRLNLLDDPNQIGAIGKVIMQDKTWFLHAGLDKDDQSLWC